MACKAPTRYKKVGDIVLSNFGQEAELQDRTVMVDILDIEGKPTGD